MGVGSLGFSCLSQRNFAVKHRVFEASKLAFTKALLLQDGPGSELEPETGTARTVFPETERGTGTFRTFF